MKMKRVTCLWIAALLVSSGAAFGQGEMDAYKYSQRDLSGTARYLGMGGAFGALGGDISAMSTNPAGLGIYRSSEVVATLSLSQIKAKSASLGGEIKNDKTKFYFDNIAYVGYFPTANESGIMGWNVGFSYNRVKNFARNYQTYNQPGSSLSDYIAATSYGIEASTIRPGQNYNPYLRSGEPWLPILGLNAGITGYFEDNPQMYYSPFGLDANGQLHPAVPQSADLQVSERGAIDQYDFAVAANISNLVFVGATFVVTDLNYQVNAFYEESFGAVGGFDLANHLKTEGTGYGANLGIIVRPTDYLRFGVAYNTPTWYKMTDYFWADATSVNNNYSDPRLSDKTPAGEYSYRFRSPDRWIFSAAAILGRSGLLSVDYEISNFGSMHLSDDETGMSFSDNDYIRDDFGVSRTLRVGAEVKVTPQFAVRAGGSWSTTPMKKQFRDGERDVITRGTIPNYTLDNGTTSYYTVGLGYRFTPNFYADLACVFKNYKENVYAFSSATNPVEQNVAPPVPVALKNNTVKVALTLGYKF